jgi:cold shock CspA family protein
MHGQIKFYDDSTAWGVILGDDGVLYVVRGARLTGLALQLGERVVFEPQPAPGGPRATAVRRVSAHEGPRKMTG